MNGIFSSQLVDKKRKMSSGWVSWLTSVLWAPFSAVGSSQQKRHMAFTKPTPVVIKGPLLGTWTNQLQWRRTDRHSSSSSGTSNSTGW